MTCLLPDYALLCICASGGPGTMTREHLAVAVALEGEGELEESVGDISIEPSSSALIYLPLTSPITPLPYNSTHI